MKMSLAGWSARTIALALLLFLSLPARSAHATGADGAWQPLSGPFQNGGAKALDDTRHCMYTWGGDHTDMVHKLPLNWYPYSGEMIETTGTPPLIRSGHTLVFDGARYRLIVFGGNDGHGDLADEYEVDLATLEWTTQPMSGITSEARREHVCAFDQNSSQLLVWGGTAADDSLRALDMNTRQWSSLSYFMGPTTCTAGSSAGP